MNGHSGGHGSSFKNLERYTVSQYLNDDKKRTRILCENSIFIEQALAITKNCTMSKNNDDLQLLFITLFCAQSDALGNSHTDFSYFCSYTTKLLSPVLLAFNFPLKTGRAAFGKQFIVKNHNTRIFYDCVAS